MSSIPSINPAFGPHRPEVIARIGPASTPAAAAVNKTDSVEFSSEAIAQSQSPEQATRNQRLAGIKAQIDSNTYDIDEKLAVVATKIARSL